MTWIWHLCFANMKLRGVRTALTILGVVIGVISIVSMLAIGIGMKQELYSMLELSGSITEITIYGVSGGKRTDRMLTDRKLEEIKKLENVEEAYPGLSVPVSAEYNQYTGYISLTGRPGSYLKQLKLGEGSLPESDGIKPQILLGSNAMDLFIHNSLGKSYAQMHEKDEEEQQESKGEAAQESGGQQTFTGESMKIIFEGEQEERLEYRMNICGVTHKDTYLYDIYCDIDVLKKYLKQIATDNGIPGQPKDENGNNYSYWIYDSATVKVDDAEHVEKVEKRLQDMGFQTYSNKEFLDSTQRSIKIAQFLLGGIGMIALIVAVIGIGNTMATSVYDRIHEIGILKVLGCDPDELLNLFLLESGILGGIGGLIGIFCSYGIVAFGINTLAVKLLAMPKGTTLAVIPFWLAAAAFFFAVLLGVAAGYFPARWAAKLRPVETVSQ